MRVIEPKAIDLISTTVAAAPEDEWSAGTTYGLGDLVKVTTATPHTVYRSLRGLNTNRPPAEWLVPGQEVATSTTSMAVGNGSKTFTVDAGKSFSPGMIVSITKTATPKTVNMTAEVVSYHAGTGALVVTAYSSTGEGTHAAWTITSEDEIGFWEEVGSTNQWAMFDKYVNTKTTADEEMTVLLRTSSADAVALFGLVGSEVELTLYNEDQSEVYWNETKNLAYGSASVNWVADWYEYFFGEYNLQADLVAIFGVTTYSGVLKIRITAESGDAVACGNVIVGRVLNLGATQYGVGVGMVDFSVRTTDELGRTTIEQGYWAKRNTVRIAVPNDLLDAMYGKLVKLRGIPTAWLANDGAADYESLVIFGIYKDFSLTVEGPTLTWGEMEIEGLT